jgi:hypothetical protein
MEKPFKVFGLGFNKTGTSSLGEALGQLGYLVAPRNQPFIALYRDQKIGRLLKQTELFEAYRDWPWPHLYPKLLDKYDEAARFVLTRRSSAAVWLESLKQHALRVNPDRNQRRLMLGYDYPHGLEEEHTRLYEAPLVAVRRHFKAAGKSHLLAEFCWDDGDGWQGLCDFLNEPVPDTPFPQENEGNSVKIDAAIQAENQRRIELQLQRLGSLH